MLILLLFCRPHLIHLFKTLTRKRLVATNINKKQSNFVKLVKAKVAAMSILVFGKMLFEVFTGV